VNADVPGRGSRVSRVGCLFVNTVSQASALQCGDNRVSNLRSRAIAVQRAIPNYVKDEARFASYALFTLPRLRLRTCAEVDFVAVDRCPSIDIGSVASLGVSASSVLRIGVTERVAAETRILHIRHFNAPGTSADFPD